jgi:hypothetical protein
MNIHTDLEKEVADTSETSATSPIFTRPISGLASLLQSPQSLNSHDGVCSSHKPHAVRTNVAKNTVSSGNKGRQAYERKSGLQHHCTAVTTRPFT